MTTRTRIQETLELAGKATKGEWTFKESLGLHDGERDFGIFDDSDFRSPIIETFGRIGHGEAGKRPAEANAAYIASASPDFLLEALPLALAGMEAQAIVEAVAAAYRKHNDPGVSDLYDEQPFPVHLPLGILRKAARLTPPTSQPEK